MIGRMLGNRYEILELIGEGGMAGVYKARCHLLNRFVAVKILRSEFVSDDEFLKKFEKEAQASASLSHPNIVNVYDVGTDGDVHYIVMELVNGITLKQYIQNKATYLSTQEIVQITRQIAMALDHAHSNGIIHRDIKPHNILITEDGHIKVADFGIARATTSATIVKTNEAMGSVHYASPEQARGGFIDARSDLYSLGILMFELATGRVPFDGETPVSIALKHLKEEVVPPSMVNVHVSASLEAVIMKLIQKDVSMRYQSAARLVDDLEMIQANPEKEIDVYLRDMDSPTTMLPRLDDFDLGPSRKPRKKGEDPKKKRGLMILTVLGALLLALLITVPFFFSSIMDKLSSASVEIPDVVNMAQADAEKALSDLGLKSEVVDTVNEPDIDSGNIVSTDPVSGTKVKTGFTVRLTVSGGGSQVKVPNVINKDQKDAEIMITNKKLRVGNVEQVFNDLPAGTVVSQDPEAGVSIREKDTVDLKVSQGPEKPNVNMPNLTGKTLEEARTILEGLQLKVGTVESKASSTIDPGRVLSQSIAQGTEAMVDTAVDLVVSKASDGTDSSGQPSAQLVTKPVFIPTNFDKATEIIKVVLVDASGTSKVVYEKQHAKTENTVKVDVKGSGTGTLKVYYGETLVYSEPIVFN